jgi:hypothetical protein
MRPRHACERMTTPQGDAVGRLSSRHARPPPLPAHPPDSASAARDDGPPGSRYNFSDYDPSWPDTGRSGKWNQPFPGPSCGKRGQEAVLLGRLSVDLRCRARDIRAGTGSGNTLWFGGDRPFNYDWGSQRSQVPSNSLNVPYWEYPDWQFRLLTPGSPRSQFY